MSAERVEEQLIAGGRPESARDPDANRIELSRRHQHRGCHEHHFAFDGRCDEYPGIGERRRRRHAPTASRTTDAIRSTCSVRSDEYTGSWIAAAARSAPGMGAWPFPKSGSVVQTSTCRLSTSTPRRRQRRTVASRSFAYIAY